ncbi:mating-type protein MAT alpha 1-domain-containing protein [Dichotomopilus funicola]|uniref:Mating-type protein MAT alpha 1-domain-containing protein n=1 Tax=Dichotomopilus funicola TaxID=1934379 RepID=A0AAN6UVH1_9PEZI|nr:mating-type protein MAT alpha 1-domain-containing protein [Dichotomopilus funicola]
MAGINLNFQAFQEAVQGQPHTDTNSSSLNMMPIEASQQSTKKKVNGFFGYRAYYSSMLYPLTQREKSPIMTKLWKADPCRKQWDFICAVYSVIRDSLSEDGITLQNWIAFAVEHFDIIDRDSYLETLGWERIRDENGAETVERANPRSFSSRMQPMSGRCLLEKCIAGGLELSQPESIYAKLSGAGIICLNTPQDAVIENIRELAKQSPRVAMGGIFGIPPEHPSLQEVTTHYVDSVEPILAPMPYQMVHHGTAGFDTTMGGNWCGEDDGTLNHHAGPGHQFYMHGE